MNIFLSWSGEQSRQLAHVFSDWLREMIQAAKPFYSPTDIEKGTRWFGKIGQTLDSYALGILFITRENREAPWIMFEAGALYKHVGESRVCPLLFGLGPTDLKGPLPLLNATRFEHDDVLHLVRTLNDTQGETALALDVLKRTFERLWPDLERRIGTILAQDAPADQKPARSDRDLMEEILETVRGIAQSASGAEAHSSLAAALLPSLFDSIRQRDRS